MYGRNPYRLGFWAALALFAAMAGVFATAQAGDNERIALKGYDPVAYFTESRPMLGDRRIRAEFDGATYQFASTEHLAMFRADPDRYLPQYGNLCTASLAQGRRYTSDPRYWLVHNGRLFLFGHPNGVKMMAANPEAVKARADANFGRMNRPASH